VHVVEAEVVSPARPHPPRIVPTPPSSRSSSSGGVERIVALSLAVMIAVLAYVYVDRVRFEVPVRPPPFDFVNPMLAAQPGECVEVAGVDAADVRWLVVRSPGVVKRPFRTDVKLPGWASQRWPDPKGFLPFLLCDARSATSARAPAPGTPPARDEPFVFPLNGFGMEIHAMGVLDSIEPTTVNWAGQRRKGYAVGIRRYGSVDGPWVLYLAQDVPVLGTMMRTYLRGPGQEQTWVFRVPESCR
jgi:hypothetical protein